MDKFATPIGKSPRHFGTDDGANVPTLSGLAITLDDATPLTNRKNYGDVESTNVENGQDSDDYGYVMDTSNVFDFLPRSYRRLMSPASSLLRNEDGDFDSEIEYDDKGFISSSSGVSLLKLLEGSVRFSRDMSKRITQQNSTDDALLNDWDYPGWGSVIQKTMDSDELNKLKSKHCSHSTLDINRSTAIAGNDLLASVLYTTGIVCGACGQNAPFAMLLSVFALFPFRKIFKEIGTALPLNGGVYVAMLNSTSKQTATFVASCSLISYCATAVVSAASCTSYAQGAFGDFPVIAVTIAILLVFALLVIAGIKDSANVALVIFSFHILTLIVLIVTSLAAIANNGGSMLAENWASPLPVSKSGGVGMDIYMGYSLALLGLTGFETSANYIEDCGPFEHDRAHGSSAPGGNGLTSHLISRSQQRRVSIFEQTIDRMWYLVIGINPMIAFCTIGVLDLTTITNNTSNILSVLGNSAGGPWLSTLVSVDAIMVLAGGVLTAYVGVTGLISQLAADRCLPSVLLITNKQFGTNHWIILLFFVLCTTLYGVTAGDVTILSGVFSIAFLMVLLSFAAANLRLKFCRPRLPRGIKSNWTEVLIGFTAMLIGLIGVIVYNPALAGYFTFYLFFFFTVTIATFQRMAIFKLLLFICRLSPFLRFHFERRLCSALKDMKKHTVLFFTKTSELHVLNKAILYARDNESCDHLIISHVFGSTPGTPGSCVISRNSSGIALYNSDSPDVGTNDATPAGQSSHISSSSSTSAVSALLDEASARDAIKSAATTKQIIQTLKENLKVLDHVYPKMRIDLLLVKADEFNPQLVEQLSLDLNILPSFMFIRCPGAEFKYGIGEFKGVRTIMQ